jgi:ubiquinone biosynthesis protein COQ4
MIRYLSNPVLKNASRYFSTESHSFENEFRTNFIETNPFQRVILSVGSAAMSLFDPYRADMICCLAETTSDEALVSMREKMMYTEEGATILREKPRINTTTLDLERLAKLPDDTLGKTYSNFIIDNNVTPDARLPVQFINDVEMAYVMQRYREVHDLVHAVLKMKTNMLGEVTVKWIEALQTRMPMCIGGAIFGASRLKTKHRKLYSEQYLPWALRVGTEANYLQSVYYEKRWEQPLDDFYKEMNIIPFKLREQ